MNIEARLIIRANEDVDIESVLENMDYSFSSTTDDADIDDMEIVHWEIEDSK